MEEKFSIIGGDIHKLVKIKPKENWSNYAWRIHEEGHFYWVPVQDWKAENNKGEWMWRPFDGKECPLCLKKWYSGAMAKFS